MTRTNLIDYTGTYTDLYQLTMAEVYFLKGHKNQKAVFDYFFRKLPFEGGYAIFAGLDDLLTSLEGLKFNEEDIEFLRRQKFSKDFINYLKDFRFRGDIYSSREGDLVFPARPVLTVEADIIEAQIIETLLLNILNFQTLIATKARRMKEVAGERMLIDFGLRRAQGVGGYYASKAAIVGGFEATSNVRAGRDFDLTVSGTMAHSFIQSYDDELTAFRDFSEGRPDDCVLLVDTYDTLESGVPNAIIVGKEMEARGQRLKGVRLDSGDLSYLSKQTRTMLDEAGLNYVKVAVSNQLDEYLIKSLVEQKAPIDLFGVGTKLVVGLPDAALDGVYKLAWAGGKSRIKLSESLTKVTLPNRKQVFRVFNKDGNLLGSDVVGLADENDMEVMHHPFDPLKSQAIKGYEKTPLLKKVMDGGQRVESRQELKDVAKYSKELIALLPDEFRRFENPHIYKVGISDQLKKERDRLIEKYKKAES